MESSELVCSSSSKYPMNAAAYQVNEQIGTGMNSNKVFLASCSNGEEVAIKQIDLSQQSSDAKEKIAKEVMGMMRVTTSDSVVQFHCSFVHSETLWIVMELQEGSVRDVLKWKYTQGIEDETIISSIIQQTLKGLSFLHGQKMIHRDIKAGNILFNKEGLIKLADFGVSAIMASHDEKRQTMVGTWQWMAPEVIDTTDYGGYDFKADIWSLGITCFELAYGTVPYSDSRPNQVIHYVLTKSPPSLEDAKINSQTNRKFSVHFKEFVSCCLQRHPESRPSSEMMLSHKFLRDICTPQQLSSALLEGLPSIGERFRQTLEIKKTNKLSALAGLGGARVSGRNLTGGGGNVTGTPAGTPLANAGIDGKSPR